MSMRSRPTKVKSRVVCSAACGVGPVRWTPRVAAGPQLRQPTYCHGSRPVRRTTISAAATASASPTDCPVLGPFLPGDLNVDPTPCHNTARGPAGPGPAPASPPALLQPGIPCTVPTRLCLCRPAPRTTSSLIWNVSASPPRCSRGKKHRKRPRSDTSDAPRTENLTPGHLAHPTTSPLA